MNPFRWLYHLFADFLIWSSGTWIGWPQDEAYQEDTNKEGIYEKGQAHQQATTSTSSEKSQDADAVNAP